MSTTAAPEDFDRPLLPTPHTREKPAFGAAGLPIATGALVIGLGGLALVGYGFAALAEEVASSHTTAVVAVVAGALLFVGAAITLRGLTMVSPGQARVIQFLGKYVGTVRLDGLRWVNPFTTRNPVSTRIRNHETAVMKVNDADGNPIEIAAVVVWQVQDTARAVFEVDNFTAFVGIQTETAVRHIATTYPYDAHGSDAEFSLRDNAEEITQRLSAEIAARVEAAGVGVIESRITHLAYAPEIAGAMLRRQQAGAVVAARQRIVEGAVGMVELALERLAAREVVELDEERKAAMVSNLLVVLCSDREAQPVVNAGSLYH
ncbi:SPFH domain-containing protein [Actinokineospora sp. NBRC 105648]|uniref:SPFH domain-containing protein n=1 Tax=Actinokineospora sp. NBRC 105648 TaxID=3032206 RepID=UPI0024A08E31|nr:SPFH domain-containing protein [Actinokineospora sp. NBRC 105648]GLZ39649.1 membrane protein [Actinokineospora sp. NBRC 105648]